MAGFLAAGMKAIRLPGMLATHQHYRWLVTSHHITRITQPVTVAGAAPASHRFPITKRQRRT